MKTKIGFFDSGIGGVTVLKECIKLLNDFSYIYYSDSINNPYGDKSKKELLKIVDNIVINLIDMGCYVIVIACNTASSVCVDYLRDKYKDIRFIAIVPAIKLMYDNDDGNGTLVMATKGTMDSDKFHELYAKYSNNNCYLLSCSGLANLIEDNDVDKISKYLEDNLSIYKNKVSSVVLGCTHYPLIKKEVSKVLGGVTFYDGSVGVANQLVRIINEVGFISENKFEVVFIDSSKDVNKEKRFFDILEG
jgi:glutamate racemase